jgi:hypothetical protein
VTGWLLKEKRFEPGRPARPPRAGLRRIARDHGKDRCVRDARGGGAARARGRGRSVAIAARAGPGHLGSQELRDRHRLRVLASGHALDEFARPFRDLGRAVQAHEHLLRRGGRQRDEGRRLAPGPAPALERADLRGRSARILGVGNLDQAVEHVDLGGVARGPGGAARLGNQLHDQHRAPDCRDGVGSPDLDHLAGAHPLAQHAHGDLAGGQVDGGATGVLGDGEGGELAYGDERLAAEQHANDRALSGRDPVAQEDVVLEAEGSWGRQGGSCAATCAGQTTSRSRTGTNPFKRFMASTSLRARVAWSR